MLYAASWWLTVDALYWISTSAQDNGFGIDYYEPILEYSQYLISIENQHKTNSFNNYLYKITIIAYVHYLLKIKFIITFH